MEGHLIGFRALGDVVALFALGDSVSVLRITGLESRGDSDLLRWGVAGLTGTAILGNAIFRSNSAFGAAHGQVRQVMDRTGVCRYRGSSIRRRSCRS